MCYAAGSIDQACPMCKVFPHARCPHIRETCRNRALHPRSDVLYLKNAEVDRFNGCGYCKWARSNPPPPPELLRYNNTGWPGCCRAPSPDEYRSITAAEWRAVSIVHQIFIPADIKAVLDNLSARAPRSFPGPPSGATTPSRTSTRPANDRKNGGGNSPSNKGLGVLAKSSATPTGRNRVNPSPQPSPHLSRSSSGTAISSSVPSSSAIENHLGERRHRATDAVLEKRVDGVHSLQSSPNRKSVDLGHGTPPPRRVSSVRRPTVTPATTSVSVSNVVANGPGGANSQGSARRKGSISKPDKRDITPQPSVAIIPPRPSRPPLLHPPVSRRQSEDDDLSSASSSSGSSDGMGSLSDNTVTSDGGFTDYLSDESEAELQRQAEAKAALLALNMAEELEFKAARQKLAQVDLRPPKSWNPTNITNTPTNRTIPRVTAGRG
ncbi:hypothetical protein FA15DRAFT_633340 [Coprinopsis marcescibilis]|uniref:Uncharacterized protein n=1 Tax=Coprinopsis marcescibilis TaxID=230819 RepID=A0A5C3L754_COPMA|nr:hypothetical protein FA15DRAFT_633340 [Coprinopsis marcescibilis]